MSFLDSLNPLAYLFYKNEINQHSKEEAIQNSQGISQDELDSLAYSSQAGAGYDPFSVVTIDFQEILSNKVQRISKYKEMSLFPEISDGIDNICDDAIVDDGTGDILKIEISEELPEGVRLRAQNIFDHLVSDILKFNKNGYNWFRKWLIEAEIYLELIPNKEGNDLVGVKLLPAHTMYPIYKNGQIISFIQKVSLSDDKKDEIVFLPNQVAYSHFDNVGRTPQDIRGYLEPSIRIYNLLKNLEDALVVYRIVRAPERRLWSIFTGKLPPSKAQQFLQEVITKYKRRINFDSTTGELNSFQNIQALTEDYWFTRDESGQGSNVETIGGGMNLGELNDVEYFLKKLYKTLKLPRSRWEESGGLFGIGKVGEITREEVKFARFIERNQMNFKNIIIDPFFTLLKMKGLNPQFINEKFYNISFCKSNLFKEFKELELMGSRMDILGNASQYMNKDEEFGDALFSRKYILQRIIGFSEDEIEENDDMIRKEMGSSQNKPSDNEESREPIVPRAQVPNASPETGNEETPPEEEQSPETPEETPEKPIELPPEAQTQSKKTTKKGFKNFLIT